MLGTTGRQQSGQGNPHRHTISEATFYNWKSKYGGVEASDVKRLKDLEEENVRLKNMYAEPSLYHSILKEVISKKVGALSQKAVN